MASAPASAPALRLLESALAAHLVPASRLEHEPRRARLATGLRTLDAALGGGWPAAALAELCGRRSAGRTSVLHASLAAALRREQTVALVDAAGAFDPRSGEAAGVVLARLLWIRAKAGRQKWEPSEGSHTLPRGDTSSDARRVSTRLALQAADLLIAAGGFGLVAIDFGEETPRAPTAAWLRLRHAAERQGTGVLIVARGRSAGAVATAAVSLHGARPEFVAAGGPLLAALETRIAVERAIGLLPAPANDDEPWLRFRARPPAW